jgi:iron(III) transport system ATP-binding protein
LSLAIPGGSRQLDRAVLHEGFSGGQYYARQSVLVRPEHVQLTAEGLSAEVENCIYQESAIYWIYVWRTGNR